MQLEPRAHAAVRLHFGNHRAQLLGARLRAAHHGGVCRPHGVFLPRLEQRGERVVFEPHLAVHIAPVERAVVAQGFKLFLRKAAHVLLQDIQHLRPCIRIRARDFIRHFQLHTQSRFQRFGHTWVVQPTADDQLHAAKVPGFVKPPDIRRKRIAQTGKIEKHAKSLLAFYPSSSRTYAMICSSFALAKNNSAKCSPAIAPRTSS